jgi:4-hydroxy-3-methylbut-2-en-1-yl diphosphate synthase IspG/GcpE
MKVTSADIAESVVKTCNDIAIAMQTYVRCPVGGRVRQDLMLSVDALHERLGHLLACLARKYTEER